MYQPITMVLKDNEIQVEYEVWKNFGFITKMVDDLVDMNTSDGIRIDLAKYHSTCMEIIIIGYDIFPLEESNPQFRELFNSVEDETIFQTILMCDFLEDKEMLKLLSYHVRDKLCGRHSDEYFKKITEYNLV